MAQEIVINAKILKWLIVAPMNVKKPNIKFVARIIQQAAPSTRLSYKLA
jgi:hypothetical protein